MSEKLVCINCNRKSANRMFNGEFRCSECSLIFSASQVKDILVKRVENIEHWSHQGLCVECGRELFAPNWCSWCNSTPKPRDELIYSLKDKIRNIDKIIEEGEPTIFRQARLGDIQAISKIFQRAKPGYEWKPLIDLGSSAVDFLISRLNSKEGTDIDKAIAVGKAIKALGEIGDERAVVPLIELIGRNDHNLFTALENIGYSNGFGLLLDKLKLNYDTTYYSLEYSVKFKIVNMLINCLENTPEEVPNHDLISASQLNDISIDIVKKTGKEERREDAWGYYTYEETFIEAEVIDCSPLRLLALQEMKRRDL